MYRNVETRPGLNSSSCHLTQSREASIKGNSIVKLWLNYFAERVRRGQKPPAHICGAATETRWNANCLNDTGCYSPALSREKLFTLARLGVETQILLTIIVKNVQNKGHRTKYIVVTPVKHLQNTSGKCEIKTSLSYQWLTSSSECYVCKTHQPRVHLSNKK